MIRRVLAAAALSTALLTTLGCGVDPAALTVPGTGVRGETYTVHIQFGNALNLPSRARVMANGAQIGLLRHVRVIDPSDTAPGSVIADVEIQTSTRLPITTTAQLRQDTLLGDLFIGLDIPTAATGPTFDEGATIPQSQTKPALQVEDLLSGVATFVSGGSLQSAQDFVDQVNAALPSDPGEIARIAAILKNDLVDAAQHTDSIDVFLQSIDVNARLLLDNKQQLGEILTPQGVVDLTNITQSLIHVIGIVGSLGGIAHAWTWLTPLAESGNATARAFVPMLFNSARPLDLTAPSNLNQLTAFLRDKLIPWAQRPTVDIRGVHVHTEASATPVSTPDQVDRIVATLRMIGMVR
ncbi:MCE family protein [Nocardia sp. 2]|uniref:MCE family protein n=2 Tax=Nocardia acididurans TaxID=2802282 RepID=A0ABS1MHS2_9NOCA|nr:MCE family protein [Nocardia acididurans]